MASVRRHSTGRVMTGDQLEGDQPQLRKSCDYCVRMKRGCDGGTPCELCSRRNKECIRSVKKRSGPAKGTKYCKRKSRKSDKCEASGEDTSAAAGASAASSPRTPSRRSSTCFEEYEPQATHSTRGGNDGTGMQLSPCMSASAHASHVKYEAPTTPPHSNMVIVTDSREVTCVTDGSSPSCLAPPKLELMMMDDRPASAFEVSHTRWGEPCLVPTDQGDTNLGSGGHHNHPADECCDDFLPTQSSHLGTAMGLGGVPTFARNGLYAHQPAWSTSTSRVDGPYAARMDTSRRGSLEEALCGSNNRRSSNMAWAPAAPLSHPQTQEMGENTMWNPHPLPDGSGTAGIVDHGHAGGGVDRHPGPPVPSVPAAFFHTNGFGMGNSQSFMPSPPSPIPFDTGGTSTPSLRELLLDNGRQTW